MLSASETKYWVACVDDDAPFLESAGKLVGRALERRPVRVPCEVELAGGAEAFRQLDAEMAAEGGELAVLITDQRMPECSGLELIERVKPDHPTTSCVLLTGYAGLDSARYAIDRRLLDRYVCKPIEDAEEFAQLVVSELERFHLRRTEAIQATQIQKQAEALRLANRRLEGMKGIAEHVAYFSRHLRTLDLDEVLDLVRDQVPGLFGARGCFLFVPDPENKLTLWRERRTRCVAAVPPGIDLNKVMREALATGQPAIALEREWCAGSADEAADAEGCAVMPLSLTPSDPALRNEANALPALLCLCGIRDKRDLSRETLEYKSMLVNDILGANIANALAHGETDRLAREDSLTGAKARRAFEEALAEEWSRYQRYGTAFCVALLDVDHLKAINDAHGHAAGDDVLRSIARIAMRDSRRCDVVGRYGGDEFAILLPETGLGGARAVLDRVVRAVQATPFPFLGESRAGVSVGVSSPDGKATPEELLSAADRALYRAKELGRGRLFVEKAHEHATRTGSTA